METKTKVQHTPGPWKVVERSRSMHIQAGNFEFLLTCPGCGEEKSVWDANAQLIAAAPNLLAALEEAVGIIEIFHGKPAWEIYRDKSPEMQRISAALRSARL